MSVVKSPPLVSGALSPPSTPLRMAAGAHAMPRRQHTTAANTNILFLTIPSSLATTVAQRHAEQLCSALGAQAPRRQPSLPAKTPGDARTNARDPLRSGLRPRGRFEPRDEAQRGGEGRRL